MGFTNYLYQILYPNNALVASQLDYGQFSCHYQLRSRQQARGKLVFCRINSGYRNDYFNIDKAMKELVPHEDGSPKHTKFISCYRVMEHIDLDAIEKLYLCNADASVLELDPVAEDAIEEKESEEDIHIYAEICPISMLVLARYSPVAFGDVFTNPANPKGAPKLFFTQLNFNPQEFLVKFEKNPFVSTPIENLHPSKLRIGILEMQSKKNKHTKGICLTSSLDDISYKSVSHGFWFAYGNKKAFFPMLTLKEIEKKKYKFWKAL